MMQRADICPTDSRRFLSLPVLVALFICCCLFSAEAQEKKQETDVLCVMSFGREISSSSCGSIVIKRQGGQLVSDGAKGSALSLEPGEYLSLDATKLIEPTGGAVMLWVRPHWDDSDPASHTFLSFAWQDGRNGYFTLSRGWWEPKGAGLTYLIGNNQEYANVARKIRYVKGEWTHLACVWKGGVDGYIRFYVNGLLAAKNDSHYTGAHQSGKILYLGSDDGSILANKRWADADFDEITFSRNIRSDESILSDYKRQRIAYRRPNVAEDGKLLETHAIFDEGIGWTTEIGAQETIRRIKKAGFNVYIPCVWHGNGTRYPSTITTAERGKHFAGGDPLARLIAIAHENGIQVHPWFTVTLRENQFARDHRGYFDVATPANAFDLHRPAFRNFITGLIADVARRYPIDGVNLDYIRTMGTCRCKLCADKYRQRYNRDLVDDIAHPKADGTLEPHLQEWQDSVVESIVREVARQVKGLRPGCIVSVDGRPQPYPNEEGRQEARWANTGLVDLVFDMEYAEPPDVERHHLVSAGFKDPSKFIMLITNYVWFSDKVVPKDADHLVKTVEYLQHRWTNGIGVYLYSMLDDKQVEMFAKGPFYEAGKPLN